MRTYSRRELYAAGEFLGDSVTRKEGGRIIYGSGGGSGGGSPAPVQSTSYNTNIPEYARPYVENMLQSAQAQIYSDDMSTFRPYTPYSTDVNNYFAGFSPLQQQAQQSAYNLQMPGQYGLASGLAGTAGMQALGAQDQSGYLGGEALGYGAAGSQYGDIGAQQALMRAQQTARQAGMYGGMGYGFGQQAAGLAPSAQQYGATAADIGMGGLGYGSMGAGYGAQAAGLSPTAQLFGQEAADIGAAGGAGAQALAQQVARQATGYGGQLARSGQLGLRAGEEMGALGTQGLGYGALGTGYGARGAEAAEQGFGAGQQYAQMATSPESMSAYMSPYMQNVVDYQKTQALRDYGIGQQLRKAQAVGAGAFGGSRQAIAEAEAERALGSQLQGIAATGSQQAFQNAQQAQQFGANLGLQGLGAGYQGLGVGMQGVGQGLAGLGTAMQGQQGRLAGLSAYQQGLQGAQSGLGQALSAGQLGLAGTGQSLAGQQARLGALSQAGQFLGQGMQGAQIGMAGISPALQGLQGAQAGLGQAGQLYGLGMQGAGYGLQGVGAQQAAGQLGLAGTAQGMQGAGVGLQGVGQAIGAGQYGLAGLGAATGAAGQLGQLGTQQLAAQQGILGTQAQMGAQQQALEQAKINQAIQDYATAQQYPYMQLGMLNAMLRGLPLQQTTTQTYQAAPNIISQIAGAGTGAAGLYGLLKKKGGAIKEPKSGLADIQLHRLVGQA